MPYALTRATPEQETVGMWTTGELSLAYLTVDGASAVEHVEAAAAAGFPAAGLRILPPVHLSSSESVVGNAQEIRRVRDACISLGVRPLDAEVASLTAMLSRDDVAAIVATAAELEFRFVQTVIEDADLMRASEKLAMLAEESRNAGLGIALEFMAFRPLTNLETALSLIDRSGADNVGVLIDALHLARSGGSPAMVAGIPAGQIAMVQLCDGPMESPGIDELATEARTRRLHPGEGALWLNELLDALPDCLPIGLEVPHPSFVGTPYIERARQSMRAMTQFMDERAKR